MQTAESVCLWNYQFKNTHPRTSSSSLTSLNRISPSKLATETSPFLPCAERLACQDEMSSKATIYCLQCKTLQCLPCDNDLHSSTSKDHERIQLNEIDGEICSRDRRHRAIFFCSTCNEMFCYLCYDNQHQHSDGREHRPEKSRPGSQPIDILGFSSTTAATTTTPKAPSAHSFEDVQILPAAPQQLTCNEQMLLESMLEENSPRSFLFIDENEEMKVKNDNDFLRQLKIDDDISVQCVSIIGNTGDGKSFTLNEVFFDGQEVFSNIDHIEFMYDGRLDEFRSNTSNINFRYGRSSRFNNE